MTPVELDDRIDAAIAAVDELWRRSETLRLELEAVSRAHRDAQTRMLELWEERRDLARARRATLTTLTNELETT